MVLQAILRNRVFFLAILVLIWIMIFWMPSFGQYMKEKRIKNEMEQRIKRKEPVHELKKEEMPINHLHAGWFHQDKMCLDSLDGKEGGKPGLWKCHDIGKNQFWFIMKDSNGFRNREFCLEGPKELGSPGDVSLRKCNPSVEHQAWVYENEALKLSGGELCLESSSPPSKNVKLGVCDEGKKSQKWKLKTLTGL